MLRLRLTALRGSLLWNCLHREPRAPPDVSGWPPAGCSTSSSSRSWSWSDVRRMEAPTPGHLEAICLVKSLLSPPDPGEVNKQVSKAYPLPSTGPRHTGRLGWA